MAEQQERGQICLEHIALLRREIEAGMLAISQNAIARLEESLWRQELLCAGLRDLLTEVREAAAEPELLRRLQVSMLALQDVNRTYMRVVDQVQQTNTALLRVNGNSYAPVTHLPASPERRIALELQA